MIKKSIAALSVLAAMVLATTAFATQYPNATYPDTLTIINIQHPTAVPHPVVPDTVRGIGGIVTGFDAKPTGFGFYMQMSNGLTHSGVDVFTGATNKGPTTPWNLQLGDSVVVYGKCQEFGGGTEIEGLDASQSTDDVLVRLVSSGNPVPAPYVATLSQLQELPTNTAAEAFEGMLVYLGGPLKVARNIALGTSNSFLLVDPSCAGPICDSVFVDGNTLTTYAPPAVGTTVDWVQGIFEQRSRGYRIQLRDGNDLAVATPPALSDAYMVDPNKVRVVFDRNVTTASATDLANYSLNGSFGTVDAAVMDGQSAVILTITNGLAAGDPEQLAVSGVVGLASGLAMGSASRNFTNGIVTVQQIQGPNADSLASVTGCHDVANFLGNNNGGTARVSVRGVCTGIQGSLYTLQDLAGGFRSGVAVFAPSVPLVVGRQYLVVGALQEFPSVASGETEVVSTVYIVDEGTATAPAAVDISVSDIADTTCDVAQAFVNGEDVEGTIARFGYGRIVANNSGSAFTNGSNFRVVDIATGVDTFFVANNISRTFLPVVGNVVDVTGIVQFSFGAFRIQPRGDYDIVDHGPVAGVIGSLPSKVQFAVTPNPARTARVSFGLPVKNTVDLSVFDISGRKVATLARGSFDAGSHSRSWDGLDNSGRAVSSGVYFYRLQVGTELYTVRGIKID